MKNSYLILLTLFFPLFSIAQSRNDAGLQGNAGAVSGFFDADQPVNFPGGATGWWHLLDVRHSNPANNLAMQFAGSFYDQNLYFRKTINNPATAWSKVVLETDGKVGIGKLNPMAKLDIGGNLNKNEYGIITPTVNVFTLNPAEIGIGGVIALGGKTGNANPDYAFAYIMGAKETNLSNNYAGYFAINTVSPGENGEVMSANYERMRISSTGNVGIGTITPSEKLSVNGNASINGKIGAKEVKVEAKEWPDYVFKKDYVLPTLEETEKHIKEKGYLPGMPSAKEVEVNGLSVSEMFKLQQKKIEELMLIVIEQSKKIKKLEGKCKKNNILDSKSSAGN